MTKSIPRVEGEWRSEEDLSGNLDGLWHARYEANDVCACEGHARQRSCDVRDGEAVQHCTRPVSGL